MNLIAAEIYALPLLHQRNDTDLTSPELDAFWKAPAQNLTYTDLILATIATLALEGTCYWLLDDTWLLAGKHTARNPLLFAPPAKMRPVKKGAEIIGWKFTDDGGASYTLLPEQVIKLTNWSPVSTDTGTPNIRPCRPAAHADLLAREYYLTSMRKAATRTAPAVISEGPVLDDAQREAMTAAIHQSELLDRPTFYSDKVTITYPAPNVPGADFTTNRLGNREEIAIALGIPPSMFQVTTSYSIGSASDRYRLIENTCIPRSIKIAEAMTRVSATLLRDDTITTKPDWDNHPVIAETRRERLSTAVTLFNTGMPWAAINTYLDLGMKPFPNWEHPFNIPEDTDSGPQSGTQSGMGGSPMRSQPEPSPQSKTASSAPIAANSTSAARSTGEPPMPLSLTTLTRLETLLTNPPSPRHAPACPCCTNAPNAKAGQTFLSVPPAAHAADYQRQMLARRKSQQATYAVLRRLLMAARSETLKNLAAADLTPDTKTATTSDTESGTESGMGGSPMRSQPEPSPQSVTASSEPSALATKAAAATIAFDPAKFTNNYTIAMRQRLRDTLKQAGRDTFADLRKNPIPGITPPPADLEDDPLLDADPNAQQALRERENLLKDVPTEIHNNIKSEIATALELGESRDKIAARIRAIFNDELSHRAVTIAQTETTAIYGAGHLASMKHSGVQYKRWLAGPDLPNSPVRPSHRAAANSPAIPIDEPFLMAGNLLQYPGDPTAPPSETINCRCCIIGVEKP